MTASLAFIPRTATRCSMPRVAGLARAVALEESLERGSRRPETRARTARAVLDYRLRVPSWTICSPWSTGCTWRSCALDADAARARSSAGGAPRRPDVTPAVQRVLPVNPDQKGDHDDHRTTHHDHAREHGPRPAGALRSLLATVMNAYSRRQFGLEAEPMLALLHQPQGADGGRALRDERWQKWSKLDDGLKELASLVGREPDRVQLVHGLRLLRVAHQRDVDREARAGDDLARERRSTRRWSARSWSTPRR